MCAVWVVQPRLVYTFEFNTTFAVEWKPDLFLLSVADVLDVHI
jgi:hypothetical protein